MFLLCCLALLSCDLPSVGSSLSSKDLRSSLLIPLGLQSQESPFLVSWTKGRMLVGKVRDGQCTYGCDERVSVLSNGSLFLSHVHREDKGKYMADVYNTSGAFIHHDEIHLQVVDFFTDHMIDLSLEYGSLGHPRQVVWSKGEEQIGRMYMGMCILGCDGRSQVFSNGSLFIQRVQKSDEGTYSALVDNASLSLVHRTNIFLYVNVSEATDGRSVSVSSVFFIGIMTVSCLTAITFMILGRFLWKQKNLEKTESDKYISYIEVRRNTDRKYAERSRSRSVIDTQVEMQELERNEEKVYEVEDLSTFQ